MELVNLKNMPKVLAKYDKVIKKVEKVEKKEKGTKNPKDMYTVTLIKEYKINGKSTDTVKATTLKEARKTIRSNRILVEYKKENTPREEKPKKEIKESKETKKPSGKTEKKSK